MRFRPTAPIFRATSASLPQMQVPTVRTAFPGNAPLAMTVATAAAATAGSSNAGPSSRGQGQPNPRATSFRPRQQQEKAQTNRISQAIDNRRSENGKPLLDDETMHKITLNPYHDDPLRKIRYLDNATFAKYFIRMPVEDMEVMPKLKFTPWLCEQFFFIAEGSGAKIGLRDHPLNGMDHGLQHSKTTATSVGSSNITTGQYNNINSPQANFNQHWQTGSTSSSNAYQGPRAPTFSPRSSPNQHPGPDSISTRSLGYYMLKHRSQEDQVGVHEVYALEPYWNIDLQVQSKWGQLEVEVQTLLAWIYEISLTQWAGTFSQYADAVIRAGRLEALAWTVPVYPEITKEEKELAAELVGIQDSPDEIAYQKLLVRNNGQAGFSKWLSTGRRKATANQQQLEQDCADFRRIKKNGYQARRERTDAIIKQEKHDREVDSNFFDTTIRGLRTFVEARKARPTWNAAGDVWAALDVEGHRTPQENAWAIQDDERHFWAAQDDGRPQVGSIWAVQSVERPRQWACFQQQERIRKREYSQDLADSESLRDDEDQENMGNFSRAPERQRSQNPGNPTRRTNSIQSMFTPEPLESSNSSLEVNPDIISPEALDTEDDLEAKEEEDGDDFGATADDEGSNTEISEAVMDEMIEDTRTLQALLLLGICTVAEQSDDEKLRDLVNGI